MLYTLIVLIVIIALLVGYGAFMRRKIYHEVDRFANWKISIMNRPITDEISKVKQMTMGGQTEEKFEVWRRDWDDILTVHLPMVEEDLFVIEEMADKYKFKKAKAHLVIVQDKMDQIEARISEMLEDLNVVVESEKQNKKNIIPIKERFHELKKVLITHRGDFKEAITYFETEVSQIEQDLSQYNQETSQGNVILGRDILKKIAERLDQLENEVLDVPKYYKDIRTILPHRLKELAAGINEMEEDGYVLEHLKVEAFTSEVENHLKVFESSLEAAHFQEVKEGLEATFEQLDWIYNQLEKEVESRHELKKEVPSFKHDLHLVGEKINLMNKETEDVQKSYLLDQSDFETQETLDRAYLNIAREFEEVDLVFTENKQAFSILFEKVEDMRVHLKELHKKAEAYREKLDHLREDEWAAKENLQNLKQKLIGSRRIVQKSNLPGIPQAYLNVIEEADDLLSEIRDRLDEKPLAMDAIQQLIEEANNHVALVFEKTTSMVESAILTEKLIQYGNRFRRRHAKLDEELKRAETYFRSYNYEESVEIAAAAIESVDPNALKQFHVELEEHIS